MIVAPARERGLKLMYLLMLSKVGSRSREGAWIEIALSANYNLGEGGRSREGAWIEIWIGCWSCCWWYVAPARERGLK